MASNKPKRPTRQRSKPQNIKFKHGGARPGSGRPQRKPLPWPENTNVKTARGLDDFLCHLIEEFTKTNPMDARALGALNTTVKILLDLRHWTDPDAATEELELDYPEDEEPSTEENIAPKQSFENLVEWARELEPYTTPEQRKKTEEIIEKAREQYRKNVTTQDKDGSN